MKKIILNVVIVLLIALAAWQGGRIYESKNKDAETMEYYDDDEFYRDFNLFNEGRQIRLDSVADYKKSSMEFDGIAQTTDLFVFMDMSGCPPCRDMTFKLLDQLLNRNPEVQISILVKSMNPRDMYVMEKELKSKYKFFLINMCPFEVLDVDDEVLSPVLFRLDKSGIIQNCYRTDYSDEQGLDTYLKTLSFEDISKS